ncbi:MAG: hypothetical protein K8R46_07305, partial [Pirellulales bacterium]|nr:hypothetical protein [Pirellulales bacterium]
PLRASSQSPWMDFFDPIRRSTDMPAARPSHLGQWYIIPCAVFTRVRRTSHLGQYMQALCMPARHSARAAD